MRHNLETQQNKLLQIVLFGQPELDEMIATPDIRQLKERITYSFKLKPFKTNDIQDYITTRLRACGYRTGGLFSASAVKEIERYSQGLVRRINILADKSLLAAYASTCQIVTEKHVAQAARDSEFATNVKPKRTLSIAAAALALVVIAGFGGWLLARYTGTQAPTDVSQSGAAAAHLTKETVTPVPEEPPIVAGSPDQEKNEVSTPQPLVRTPVAVDETVEIKEENIIITDAYGVSAEQVSTPSQEATIITEQEIDRQIERSLQADVAQSTERASDKAGMTSADDELHKQLLGMTAVYQLQDLGASKLSDSEAYILKKQLQVLPPEVNYTNNKSLSDDRCQLCWAIIYRPLTDPENL